MNVIVFVWLSCILIFLQVNSFRYFRIHGPLSPIGVAGSAMLHPQEALLQLQKSLQILINYC